MEDTIVALIVIIVLVVGVNTLLWGTSGLIRLAAAGLRRIRGGQSPVRPHGARRRSSAPLSLTVDRRRVAVLIAAHNEEMVIESTLRSARRQVRARQIFVASDDSRDNTAGLARSAGANVLEISPNVGKAGALVKAVEHFDLTSRFDVIVLLDADTVLSDDYLATGLPLFDEAGVVAVAGRATTRTSPGPSTLLGRILVAYRERVYISVQFLIKFGQAASRINVVTIVPGFASMYRSSVFTTVDVAAAGLTIEDYNMTFEIHVQRLGRIAFHPGAAVASTQDPDSMHDYLRQIGRWSLGFWQTVLRHPWQPRRFWVALYLYIIELIASSVLLVLLAPVLLIAFVAEALSATGWNGVVLGFSIGSTFPPGILIIGFLVPDYALTVIVACIARRPSFLLLGLAFPLLRIIDSAVCLHRLPEALLGESNGVWTSPSRRPAELGRAAS